MATECCVEKLMSSFLYHLLIAADNLHVSRKKLTYSKIMVSWFVNDIGELDKHDYATPLSHNTSPKCLIPS